MICIAIIVTLVAILTPVFIQAKEQAKRTVCASNLHQLFIATSTYRSDNGGDGKYGSDFDMGLPPRIGSTAQYSETILNLKMLKCGRFPNPQTKELWSYRWAYIDPPSGHVDYWKAHSLEFEDRSVLAFDINHNSLNEPLYSDYISHTGIGVTIGGALLKPHKPGDFDRLRWWVGNCSTDCAFP